MIKKYLGWLKPNKKEKWYLIICFSWLCLDIIINNLARFGIIKPIPNWGTISLNIMWAIVITGFIYLMVDFIMEKIRKKKEKEHM